MGPIRTGRRRLRGEGASDKSNDDVHPRSSSPTLLNSGEQLEDSGRSHENVSRPLLQPSQRADKDPIRDRYDDLGLHQAATEHRQLLKAGWWALCFAFLLPLMGIIYIVMGRHASDPIWWTVIFSATSCPAILARAFFKQAIQTRQQTQVLGTVPAPWTPDEDAIVFREEPKSQERPVGNDSTT